MARPTGRPSPRPSRPPAMPAISPSSTSIPTRTIPRTSSTRPPTRSTGFWGGFDSAFQGLSGHGHKPHGQDGLAGENARLFLEQIQFLAERAADGNDQA